MRLTSGHIAARHHLRQQTAVADGNRRLHPTKKIRWRRFQLFLSCHQNFIKSATSAVMRKLIYFFLSTTSVSMWAFFLGAASFMRLGVAGFRAGGPAGLAPWRIRRRPCTSPPRRPASLSLSFSRGGFDGRGVRAFQGLPHRAGGAFDFSLSASEILPALSLSIFSLR